MDASVFAELSNREWEALRLPRATFAIRHPRAADVFHAVAYGGIIASLSLSMPLPLPGFDHSAAWVVFMSVVGCILTVAGCILGAFSGVRVPLWFWGLLTGVQVFCMVTLVVSSSPSVLFAPFVLLGPSIGLYALGAYRTAAWAWLGYVVNTVVFSLAQILGKIDNSTRFSATVFGALTLLLPTLLGVISGNRRRYVRALVGRAGAMLRERDQHAQLAASQERARIAREMHDIVSHNLTIMVTLAEGASRCLKHDPARSQEALGALADAGRRALGEMRRMLGVLGPRDEERGVAGSSVAWGPQPEGEDLSVIAVEFRRAGLPVSLVLEGAAVPPGMEFAVSRIVSEALTNALRYASGASAVDVVVRGGDDEVEIVVTDDGVSSGPDPGRGPGSGPRPGIGAGRGLIGMRERVALYDGDLGVGPREDSPGWRLRARLRVENAATGQVQGPAVERNASEGSV